MKRALIVLLLLAVLAGGLFAQVSVGGQIATGILLKSTAEDTTIGVHHPDGQNAFRARISVGYTNDAGTSGMNSRFNVRDNGIGADFAWAWFKPLDNLWVNVGKLDQWNYGSMGGVDDNFGFADPLGLLVRYLAMPGLNILAAGNIGTRFNDYTANSIEGFGVGNEPKNIGFSLGARYVTSAFGAMAAVRGADAKLTQGLVGFDFLGLGDLGLTKLAIDARISGLDDLDTKGAFVVGPRVHFALGSLGIQLRSQVYIPMLDEQELDLAATLQVAYAITPNVTVGILGGFEKDANIPSGNDDYRDNWDVMNAYGRAIGGTGDSGLVVKPYVNFGLGGLMVRTGYAYYGLMDTEDAYKHLIFLRIERWF